MQGEQVDMGEEEEQGTQRRPYLTFGPGGEPYAARTVATRRTSVIVVEVADEEGMQAVGIIVDGVAKPSSCRIPRSSRHRRSAAVCERTSSLDC
jgi:hypothetical protein